MCSRIEFVPQAYFRLGVSYYALHMYWEAAEAFVHGLRIAPDNNILRRAVAAARDAARKTRAQRVLVTAQSDMSSTS